MRNGWRGRLARKSDSRREATECFTGCASRRAADFSRRGPSTATRSRPRNAARAEARGSLHNTRTRNPGRSPLLREVPRPCRPCFLDRRTGYVYVCSSSSSSRRSMTASVRTRRSANTADAAVAQQAAKCRPAALGYDSRGRGRPHSPVAPFRILDCRLAIVDFPNPRPQRRLHVMRRASNRPHEQARRDRAERLCRGRLFYQRNACDGVAIGNRGRNRRDRGVRASRPSVRRWMPGNAAAAPRLPRHVALVATLWHEYVYTGGIRKRDAKSPAWSEQTPITRVYVEEPDGGWRCKGRPSSY